MEQLNRRQLPIPGYIIFTDGCWAPVPAVKAWWGTLLSILVMLSTSDDFISLRQHQKKMLHLNWEAATGVRHQNLQQRTKKTWFCAQSAIDWRGHTLPYHSFKYWCVLCSMFFFRTFGQESAPSKILYLTLHQCALYRCKGISIWSSPSHINATKQIYLHCRLCSLADNSVRSVAPAWSIVFQHYQQPTSPQSFQIPNGKKNNSRKTTGRKKNLWRNHPGRSIR